MWWTKLAIRQFLTAHKISLSYHIIYYSALAAFLATFISTIMSIRRIRIKTLQMCILVNNINCYGRNETRCIL